MIKLSKYPYILNIIYRTIEVSPYIQPIILYSNKNDRPKRQYRCFAGTCPVSISIKRIGFIQVEKVRMLNIMIDKKSFNFSMIKTAIPILVCHFLSF